LIIEYLNSVPGSLGTWRKLFLLFLFLQPSGPSPTQNHSHDGQRV
jgi:hypothetical protein